MTIPGSYVAGDVLTAANMNLLPAGKVAIASVTSTSSANAGTTALLAASSFTAVTGRRYRITISFYDAVIVGSGTSEVQIRRGSTQIASAYVAATAGTYPGRSFSTTDVPGAGTVTYNFYTFTNATTIQIEASSTAPYSILVEDIGAS